jgi:hypothetical protein
MQEQGRGKGLLAALRGTQEDSPSHVPDSDLKAIVWMTGSQASLFG